MDYFGCKSPKITKRWGLHPRFPASGGWELCLQTTVGSVTSECARPCPLKLLVDADAWQIGGQTKTYVFCLSLFKKHPKKVFNFIH